MVATQPFFGKVENIGPISKEEVFLLFSIFQSHSVHSVENIYVIGMVTHIAIALGLRNKVAHLEPFYSYNLINIERCLNRGLVRQEGSNTYKILVL